MSSQFKQRHPGTRWQIVFDSFEGLPAQAVIALQKGLQRLLPYVLETVPCGAFERERHLCLVGCAGTHPMLRELIGKGLLPEPQKEQGFSIASCPSPWNDRCKVVAIAGYDEAGLLHGAHYFNAQVLPSYVGGLRLEDCPASLERIPTLKLEEAPLVANRGIWTWGYSIYDYRSFIDNMARLRMNMLTIWNDVPPLNSAELISYAHSRGIRVIFGFAWGWGLTLDLANTEVRRNIRDDVVKTYRRDYAHLPLDGIYFQTLTEHSNMELGGRSTASLACELVNETAAALFEISPSLYIQFGLHASSIGERYQDLLPLHPKVSIVWENAGSVPYLPSLDQSPDGSLRDNSTMPGVLTPEETIAYSRKIMAFRGPDKEFALVPKGWTGISWGHEFENHGPFILGERSRYCQELQSKRREARWDFVNQSWFRHYPLAARFYREMLVAHHGVLTVTGLVEDGAFEQTIQPSVALFAETLWNPKLSDQEILCRAMSPYYGISQA